jgi:SnoaL-like domain
VRRPQDFADRHVAAFNDAVARGDFAAFLDRFHDEAVMRFENVPGAGVLEYAGRPAWTAAYQRQPPDDEMRAASPAEDEDGTIVVRFVWARDGSAGVVRLTVRDGLVTRMVVTFA